MTSETETIMCKPYKNITIQSQINLVINKASVRKSLSFSKDGISYEIDHINVVLELTTHEKEVGTMLSRMKNGTVLFIPRVSGKHKNVKTPDYLLNGNEPWDLKEYSGCGKDGIRDAIKDKKEQANRFIIDVSKSSLTVSEIRHQAATVFKSFNTGFVLELIVLKNGRVLLDYIRR